MGEFFDVDALLTPDPLPFITPDPIFTPLASVGTGMTGGSGGVFGITEPARPHPPAKLSVVENLKSSVPNPLFSTWDASTTHSMPPNPSRTDPSALIPLTECRQENILPQLETMVTAAPVPLTVATRPTIPVPVPAASAPVSVPKASPAAQPDSVASFFNLFRDVPQNVLPPLPNKPPPMPRQAPEQSFAQGNVLYLPFERSSNLM